MLIPCLSLWQPWASLIRPGDDFKSNETRHCQTAYRGPLAIHAAKKMDGEIRDYCLQDPFLKMLKQAGFLSSKELPLGAVVAVCNLRACAQVHDTSYTLPYLGEGGRKLTLIPPTGNEYAFGNYATGRFVWVLDSIRVLDEPLPLRGQQGLWTAELPVEAYFADTREAV